MSIIKPATNAVAGSEADPYARRRVGDRVRLGRALALWAALGVLGGCGPAEPSEPSADPKDGTQLRLEDDSPPEECVPGAPVLVVNGGTELVLECQPGATYSDPGATATDGCGNPVEVHAYNTGADSSGPGPNLNYEGSYTVSYAAWNDAGDANASRTVLVEDRIAPVLTLRGPEYMVHTCNTFWADPGADAVDGCYGNLTSSVWRAGDVNAWAEGIYTVSYNVTDGGGNSAVPVTRTVEVVDCPW